MRRPPFPSLLLAASAVLASLAPAGRGDAAQPVNGSPPSVPVKLVFIHHSTGENWLSDENGTLGIALRDSNYFVSDTYYGWGPIDPDTGDSVGSYTDIGHWYTWFSGPHRDTYLAALFPESRQATSYSRRAQDPGGENRIVLFKSCFPNSQLGGSPSDPVPPIGSNPLRGESAGSEAHTVANAKGIYLDLLTYFATRTDKLFVLVTSPPLVTAETSASAAANARALDEWLVKEWLAAYPHRNVAVLDFYNVLTSDGGSTRTNDPTRNDLGWADGNHHRLRDGAVERMQTVASNVSAYGSDEWDSHPSTAGNLKATGELVALLNVAYHCWQGDGGCPASGPEPPCTVSCSANVPGSGTTGTAVPFSATASASGCTGTLSYDWDFGDGSAHGSAATAAHAYALAGSYPWRLVVRAGSATCERSGTVTVTSQPQPLPYVYVVPAVAHSPGAEGSLWRTDVAAVNRGSASASLVFTFHPVGGEAVQRSATLGGPGTREWADVLVSVLGYAADAGVSGALEVGSDRPLCVTSRTYNRADAGSFGGYLPAVASSSGLAAGQVGILPHLKSSGPYRTNIGVVNLGAASADVTIRLHGANGAAAGTPRPLTVPAGGLVQESGIFAVCGAGSHDIAFATVEVTTAGGRVSAFASVIDGGTNDPTIVPLVVP